MTAREAELTQQLDQNQQALAVALRENQLLREKINLLLRRVFGASSEKMDVAQLQLLLSGAELVEPASVQEAQSAKAKAQPQTTGSPGTSSSGSPIPSARAGDDHGRSEKMRIQAAQAGPECPRPPAPARGTDACRHHRCAA